MKSKKKNFLSLLSEESLNLKQITTALNISEWPEIEKCLNELEEAVNIEHNNPMFTQKEILCCSTPNGTGTNVSYSGGSVHLKIRIKAELLHTEGGSVGTELEASSDSAVWPWASLSFSFLIFEMVTIKIPIKGCEINCA